MTASAPARVIRLARPLYWICSTAMVVLPILVAYASATGGITEARLRARFGHLSLPDPIDATGWAAVFAMAALSVALVLLALWHMRALFALYRDGRILGRETANRIRRIGQAVLALSVVGVLGDTLVVLALTLDNPPGERTLSVAFGNDDLFLAMAAGLLIVIGWAMTEAARVAEDNAGFI